MKTHTTSQQRRDFLGTSGMCLAAAGSPSLAATPASTTSDTHLWAHGGHPHAVKGGGGVTLRVREWGRATAQPIVLIHGWNQSFLSWTLQYTSPLLADHRIVAYDLRGHGESDKPMNEAAYTNGQLWADDLAAVIDTLELHKPVLVGSSYAGFVICDYLQRHGHANVGAINFVGAAVINTLPEYFGDAFGALAPLMASADTAVSIDAIRRFVHAYYKASPPSEIAEMALCYNMLTPPQVRQWCVSRTLDFTPTLAAIQVPTLVSYGAHDAFVRADMQEHILRAVRGSVASRYDNASHATMQEDAPRFNRELLELARRVAA